MNLRDARDWQAFWERIDTVPEDDTTRLVAADWLEDHGERHHAQFIRDQVERPASPCRSVPLTMLVHLEPLVGPLPHKFTRSVSGIGGATVTYPNGMEFWFRRGFVDEVQLPLSMWEESAVAIVRNPLACIQRVTLSGIEPYLHSSGTNRWGWLNQSAQDEFDIRWSLPYQLWKLIAVPQESVKRGRGRANGWDSRAAALSALSDAAVAVGRKRAGLDVASSSVG
jgi:uncharacterized protein (TIGR02996 family)